MVTMGVIHEKMLITRMGIVAPHPPLSYYEMMGEKEKGIGA